jgi:hypothetical protein
MQKAFLGGHPPSALLRISEGFGGSFCLTGMQQKLPQRIKENVGDYCPEKPTRPFCVAAREIGRNSRQINSQCIHSDDKRDV